MFGPFIPPDTYRDAIGNSEGFASMAERWRKDADRVAGRSPRMAARMRDISKAYSDLAFLCGELKREADQK